MSTLRPRTKLIAKKLGWKLLRSQILFTSPWYTIRRDQLRFRGHATDSYTYIDHPGAVVIAPLTSAGEILLLRCYRYTIDRWSWELPAGTMADHPGSSPARVARAELSEELGATCRCLKPLGRYFVGNGFASLRTHYYLAVDAKLSSQPSPQPIEGIVEVRAIPLGCLPRILASHRVTDAESALGLHLLVQHFRANQTPNPSRAPRKRRTRASRRSPKL